MFSKLFHLLFQDFYLFTGAYSNQVFPEPFSKEEEEVYVKKLKKGIKRREIN